MGREKIFISQPFLNDDPSRWDYKKWALCAYVDYRYNRNNHLTEEDFRAYAEALVICYFMDMPRKENPIPSPERWHNYVRKCHDVEVRMHMSGKRNSENVIAMGHFLLNRTIEAMPDEVRRMPQRL